MNKILIVYFSWSGKSKAAAEKIGQMTGGELFQIEPEQAYSTNYSDVVAQARRELANNIRPKLKNQIDGLESVDLVFACYPNWCRTMPMPMFTFFENYDFSGKTIAPLCLNGGGGLGRSVDDIKNLCPGAKVVDGLAIGEHEANHPENLLFDWLKKLKHHFETK